MFLILLSANNVEAGIVLNLILIFELFEPRCSYKIVLIKKKSVICELRPRHLTVIILPKGLKTLKILVLTRGLHDQGAA